MRIGPGRRAGVLVPMPRVSGGIWEPAGRLCEARKQPGDVLSSSGQPHGERGHRSDDGLGVSSGGRGAVFPPWA